jgi:hypothetical protein
MVILHFLFCAGIRAGDCYMKSQYHLGLRFSEPQGRWDGFAICINQETGQAIDLFRRTTLAGISIGIDDLTFA